MHAEEAKKLINDFNSPETIEAEIFALVRNNALKGVKDTWFDKKRHTKYIKNNKHRFKGFKIHKEVDYCRWWTILEVEDVD